MWLIVARGATPGNAVLILSAPTTQANGQATSPVVGSQSTEVASGASQTPEFLAVYVSGEVIKPGVYTLPAGSRVADAVAASGGFTTLANPEGINLAARLHDEQHLSVPRQGETVEAEDDSVTGPGAEGGSAGGRDNTTPRPTPPLATTANKVNINTATAKELEALPGIGEVLSKRIVADREAHGPFKAVDDLMRVPGIKEGLMSQLRDLVSVGP